MLPSAVRQLRPRHWIKNLMLFFPPFFAGTLFGHDPLRQILPPFAAFCLGASSVYILNDIRDIDNDRAHPVKRKRPLPSGQITLPQARLTAALLFVASLAVVLLLPPLFGLLLVSYLALNVAYSYKLKELAVVELFCVALGFLLRLEAGGVAFGVTVSPWLFMSVLFLALFLTTGKRLAEWRHVASASPETIRPVLALYPSGFLEGAMLLTGTCALLTYTVYIINHGRTPWTIVICCLGLLVYIKGVLNDKRGDPIAALTEDHVLLGVSLTWLIAISMEIYY